MPKRLFATHVPLIANYPFMEAIDRQKQLFVIYTVY